MINLPVRQPPLPGFMAGLPDNARAAIRDFLAVAQVGSLQPVRDGLTRLASATEADEFMIVSDVFDPALRLRSLDIVAEAMRG